ncbi:hypothetical protein OE88DRAFT_1748226 [Heliocybe sulcata]|uniref:Uncharacterized protein n=1 Tax=Heliocybe sulcata TaxID=5364 RepID=A0A5C3N1T8_9AGAM|nr:hypothetical protein OE88DRAFT_1748226 [Heliocybe sulcata]
MLDGYMHHAKSWSVRSFSDRTEEDAYEVVELEPEQQFSPYPAFHEELCGPAGKDTLSTLSRIRPVDMGDLAHNVETQWKDLKQIILERSRGHVPSFAQVNVLQYWLRQISSASFTVILWHAAVEICSGDGGNSLTEKYLVQSVQSEDHDQSHPPHYTRL